MKTRRMFRIISISVLTVFLVGVSLLGYRYYQNRYVSHDFYALVPEDFDMTPRERRNMQGMGIGEFAVYYQLPAVNEAGERRVAEFDIIDQSPNLPQPGDYVRIQLSNSGLSNGEQIVRADEVPSNVREALR